MKNIFETIKGHPEVTAGTAYTILFSLGFCHLLNDMIQSVVPAMYPILKDGFGFTFAQIGIITLVYQLASSIFQPFVGLYADTHPKPYSLASGMCFTIAGLFFGLMFGLGGIGSAFFGWLADLTSIGTIFQVSTLLPLLGIVAVFLPDIRPAKG